MRFVRRFIFGVKYRWPSHCIHSPMKAACSGNGHQHVTPVRNIVASLEKQPIMADGMLCVPAMVLGRGDGCEMNPGYLEVLCIASMDTLAEELIIMVETKVINPPRRISSRCEDSHAMFSLGGDSRGAQVSELAMSMSQLARSLWTMISSWRSV